MNRTRYSELIATLMAQPADERLACAERIALRAPEWRHGETRQHIIARARRGYAASHICRLARWLSHTGAYTGDNGGFAPAPGAAMSLGSAALWEAVAQRALEEADRADAEAD